MPFIISQEEVKRIVDNQANINTGGEDQAAPETLLEYITAPDAPDIGEGGRAADMPPPEKPAPEVTDSAAQVEAEKQAGQDKAADPAPPAPEDKAQEPERKGRGGRPPKTDKVDKAPETDKPKKADRARPNRIKARRLVSAAHPARAR